MKNIVTPRLISTPRKKTIKRAILLFAIIMLIVSFIPFERTVVPPWRFQVIDEAGNPIRNTTVRQIWRHYSVETEDHQEDSMTDQNGFTEFPRRTLKVSYFQIVKEAIDKFRELSIHASYGPSSYVLVLSREDYMNNAYYKKGRKLPDRIVVWPFKSEKQQ